MVNSAHEQNNPISILLHNSTGKPDFVEIEFGN